VSGSNLLLDTNILIYGLKGLAEVRPYFSGKPYVSEVTEIEVLGVKGLSEQEISAREAAIEFCTIIPITGKIKYKAIEIKRIIKVPIPDAIIAATAIVEGFSLVTADTGFKRIKDLSLILIAL